MRVLSGAAAAVSAVILVLACCVAASQDSSAERIRVVPNEAEHRVDITIDGQAFTSYIWPEKVAKPVLYPLRTAKGSLITRGFPLEPRPGERIDHPHHVGLWFNYGNVDGFDFWNNSEAIRPEDAPKMGNIRHRAITLVKSGPYQGELETEADWITSKQQLILKERTRFIFRGAANFRSIDRITTLQAVNERVRFPDDKEGVLGLRVARALEAPSDKPEVFTDAAGRPTTVAKLENAGVNGVYLTSEGNKGEAAWGTRGRWCNLNGQLGDEPVTITIFDHPANPGFPTFWHARGYGLFAANPLGQKIFTNGKQELNFTLAPNQSVTFRYRILISSQFLTPEQSESDYKDFLAAYR
jgi:Methane oxygenase PmoA